MSDFPNALEYAFKALRVNEEMRDRVEIGSAKLVIGNVYIAQGDKTRALEYYLQCLADFEAVGLKQGIASATSDIGMIYSHQSNEAEALKYYFKAMDIYEEAEDPAGMVQTAICIGGAYASLHNYASALAYSSAALKKAQEMGAQSNVCYALEHMGRVYLSLAQDSVEKPLLNHRELPKGLYAGADIPASKKECLRLAISYLEQAHDSAKAIGLMDAWRESSHKLASAYRMAGNPGKALEAYEDYVKIKDSIFSQENLQKTVQRQMKYDFDKKEAATRAQQEKKDIQQRNIRNSTLTGMAGLLIFSLVAIRQRNRVRKEKANVEVEKGKSEALLLNILPHEVAEELKAKGTTTARHYDNVTVLFTDFVNFTQASENMGAQGLIDELHACFKMFDEITSKYNIEKIKTIGDAYLAVAGLPTADPQHAENVVKAAMEIIGFMENRLAKMGSERTFAIRIGIHSGSVVAGIVGVKKFAYDIWGDTVNTAARMEQNSEAGKINISQTTYELVKDNFTCEYRGEVEAKGKGVMKMYFVS